MLTVINHPLIKHKLATMRNKDTGTKDFAENLDEIASLMVFEITKDLKTKVVEVETPMGLCDCEVLDTEVVLAPIMRAGLGMVEGIRNIIPTAKVGHIGMYRDEETLIPQQYYAKFPNTLPDAQVFILDPMLATGGSALAAIRILKNHGAKHIKLVCIVGVQEGIDAVEKEYPEVDIYLAAKDKCLNEISYIVPGLGDAGDRIYGTK
ncbi:MAG: uracil phosphoribosyltransferase [Erysipelotrichales bacterium]|nr:uracil phosphoribosyltransferase [Erysipelotrichales bacterium]